ncbi:MAG: YggT family protein [Clostridiales Family XIII bacterium]|nr:YggT family protein [Clostridiales Family XIII bacterium]
MGILISAINFFANFLVGMLIIRALLSWVVNPYTANRFGFLARLYNGLIQLTEPLIRPVRAFLSRFRMGPFDFSLFVTVILIGILQRILIRILLFLM